MTSHAFWFFGTALSFPAGVCYHAPWMWADDRVAEMSKTRQKLEGNAEFRKVAEEFFVAVDAASCKTEADALEALKSGRGCKIIDGAVFAGSAKLWGSLERLKVKTAELAGALVCHEEDVETAAWEAVKSAAATGEPPIKILAALVSDAVEATTTFIAPNYVIRLDLPVTSIVIGPVRVRRTIDIAAEIEARGWPLRLTVGEGDVAALGANPNLPLTPTCFAVNVRASDKRVADEALVLVNTAVSLLRLIILPGVPGTHFPKHGDLEAAPFAKPVIQRRHAMLTAEGFRVGGASLPGVYHVNNVVAAARSTFSTMTRNLFEAGKKNCR